MSDKIMYKLFTSDFIIFLENKNIKMERKEEMCKGNDG